jgi:hypothetical protein
MATNLNPSSPDALLKIVELVKEYYVELPPQHQRGRPRTFSGQAFLLLAVVINGASLYLKKINDLAIEAISRFNKNPRKVCKSGFSGVHLFL